MRLCIIVLVVVLEVCRDQCQAIDETTTLQPETDDRPQQRSEENVREICRAELHNSKGELSELINEVIKNEKKLQGTCIKANGDMSWFNGVTKTCDSCSDKKCSGDTACMAVCAVRNEVRKTRIALDRLAKAFAVNLTSLEHDYANIFSQLKQEKDKSMHYESLANVAIALAISSILGFIAAFVAGIFYYNRMATRVDRIVTSKPVSDAKHEGAQENEPKEGDNLV